MLNKQYSRVIRWINRAQSRSADGNFSDAILDVECARAELDNARQELLLCHKNGSERKGLMSLPLIGITAIFITLFMATPTRMQPPAQILAPLPKDNEIAELPANDENVSVDTTEAAKPVAAVVVASIQEPAPQVDSRKTEKVVKKTKDSDKLLYAVQKPSVPKKRPAERLLSDKDMYRLIEVGRKALKQKDESVVLEFNQ